MSDIQKAIVAGPDQITAYPLFTFPYSKAGNYRKLKKVKLPNLIDRRKMYREIHNYLVRQDFQRVSVWGFKRGKVPRYSSVTRNHFIGLGAGAGSHIPGRFYFNTFSVKDYIHRCQNQQLPIALNMELTKTASKYYWLYWRLYDTYINKNQIRETFGENDIKIKQLISIFNILNLAEENEDEIILTEKGSFWLHLLQNYFSLNYINKVWSTAGETAFPNSIKI